MSAPQRLAITLSLPLVLALGLAACSPSAPVVPPTDGSSASEAPVDEAAAGSADGDSVELDAGEVAGEEICTEKVVFGEIDALLVAANRENPPAPSYALAANKLEGTFPADSINETWHQLALDVREFAFIVESEDDAAIAAAADLVVDISENHLKLYSLFMTHCG